MAPIDGSGMTATPDDRLAAALEAVSGRLGAAVLSAVPQAGGLTNQTWRLETDHGAMLLRLSGGREAELGIDRDSELVALRAAEMHGLGPRLLLAEPAAGLLVTLAAPGLPWQAADARLPRNLQRIGRWFATLHELPPPAALRRLALREVLADLSLTLARGGLDTLPEPLYETAADHCDRLDETGVPAFCHNDVHHLNVIDDAVTLTVVDWEYSAVGEAVVDLAEFAANHGLDTRESAILLEAYVGHGGRLAAAAFDSARWLASFRALLWVDVRIASTPSMALALGSRRGQLLAQLEAG